MLRRRLSLRNLLFVLVLSFCSILPSGPCAFASDSGSKPASPVSGAASATESGEPTAEHIRQLLRDGAWADAEAEARRLLTVSEESKGNDSLEVAQALDLLVESLWRGKKARRPEARPLAERAVSIKEKLLGADHPDLVISLKNLGNVCLLTGDLAAADVDFRRMIAIAEAALGPNSPEVAKGLNNLASVFYQKGDFSEAFSMLKRALSIQEANMTSDDSVLLEPLNNLGNIAKLAGHPFEARDYLQRALDIHLKRFPPDHPDQAPLRNNLAIVFRDLGDYEGALKLYAQALDIRKKTYGDESEAVANSYFNVAETQRRLGDFTAARASWERSLEISRKVLDPEGKEVAESMSNLGLLLGEMGDYASALPVQQRGLELLEKSLGPEHSRVGQALHGLGHTQEKLGDSVKAEATYLKAIAISEKADGPEHPMVAASLDLLASLKERSDDLSEAKPLYERALAIRTKVYGSEHPEVAVALDHLGRLLLMQGDYAGARMRLEEALRIQERFLGPNHEGVGQILTDLAQLHFATGEVSRSLDETLRAESIFREHFRRTAGALSEREALALEAMGISGLDIALSALTRNASSPAPEAAERVWNEVLKSRAMVLDQMAARHHPNPGETEEIAVLRRSLAQAKRRLASLAVQGPDPKHPDAYRDRLAQIRSEAERQERLLADKSASFHNELLHDSASLHELRKLLPRSAALVAYVRYQRLLPPPLLDGKPGPPPNPLASYGVFVLRGDRGDAAFISLAPGAQIEKLVHDWRKEVSQPPPVLDTGGNAAEAHTTEAGFPLRKAAWDPLARSLRGVRTVFLVPEGALNLVSFSVLPRSRGGYLIDSGPVVHYLSAERDLLSTADPLSKPGKIFLLGGPDYDASPERADATVVSASDVSSPTGDRPSSAPTTYRSPGGACPELRSLRFDPLPTAAAEVADLNSFFLGREDRAGSHPLVLNLTGAAATESAFKNRAPGCKILHLATHGFFLGEACSPTASPASADSRLILSGLALAGANRRAEVVSCSDCEDGILTSEEIASLDLSGVEWAVLAACETGVGKVISGEGVFGMRRAFQIAGARTLIMSLWKVEDAATTQWMRRLYEARAEGLTTPEAMQKAGLETLHARRARGESTHPFFWGAFVAAGDWR